MLNKNLKGKKKPLPLETQPPPSLLHLPLWPPNLQLDHLGKGSKLGLKFQTHIDKPELITLSCHIKVSR